MEKKQFPKYDIEKLAGLKTRAPKSWYENTYRGKAKFSNNKKIPGKLLDDNDEYNKELLALTISHPLGFYDMGGNPKAEFRALLRKILVSKPNTELFIYEKFFKITYRGRTGYDLYSIGRKCGWWIETSPTSVKITNKIVTAGDVEYYNTIIDVFNKYELYKDLQVYIMKFIFSN